MSSSWLSLKLEAGECISRSLVSSASRSLSVSPIVVLSLPSSLSYLYLTYYKITRSTTSNITSPFFVFCRLAGGSSSSTVVPVLASGLECNSFWSRSNNECLGCKAFEVLTGNSTLLSVLLNSLVSLTSPKHQVNYTQVVLINLHPHQSPIY